MRTLVRSRDADPTARRLGSGRTPPGPCPRCSTRSREPAEAAWLSQADGRAPRGRPDPAPCIEDGKSSERAGAGVERSSIPRRRHRPLVVSGAADRASTSSTVGWIARPRRPSRAVWRENVPARARPRPCPLPRRRSPPTWGSSAPGP